MLSRNSSLALRLVALFSLIASLMLSAVGYWLYHALMMQLDARNGAELNGKRLIITRLVATVRDQPSLQQRLSQIAEVQAGHPHLSIGIHSQGQWLLKPANALAAPQASVAYPHQHGDAPPVTVLDGHWWVQRWTIALSDQVQPAQFLIGLDIADSQTILREHGWAAAIAVIIGALISGSLAFLVVRQGLKPLHQLAQAAEQMTSAKLASPLEISHAPSEVRSLLQSLNRMLARLGDSFQSLEQFSADLAHELRTPLNNLMLRTQVTLSRPRALEDYQEALHANLEELERLSRMVADMLFLARAERGMLTLNLMPVNLAGEALSLAEYFEIAASERGQHIVVSGQALAQCDRLMVRRAVTNLLANAVRYAPSGACIQVWITQEGDGCSLTVSNPSEPVAQLDQLFKRFTRSNSARDTDGLGLGLAIVDSIMRLHHGGLSAEYKDRQLHFRLQFIDRK